MGRDSHSLDDVCRGMYELQARLMRSRGLRSYRETAQVLYQEKVDDLRVKGHEGMSAYFSQWLTIYERLFPLPKKEEKR